MSSVLTLGLVYPLCVNFTFIWTSVLLIYVLNYLIGDGSSFEFLIGSAFIFPDVYLMFASLCYRYGTMIKKVLKSVAILVYILKAI